MRAIALLLFMPALLEAQSAPPTIEYAAQVLETGAVSMGEAVGVAASHEWQRLFILTRGSSVPRAASSSPVQLLEFTLAPRFVAELAPNLYGWLSPHSVRLHAADTALWVVDSGSRTVVKLDLRGRVRLVLGRRPPPTITAPLLPPPPSAIGLFAAPTDVAIDSAGNIYVTDGHANGRVVKLSRTGRWLGTTGNGTFEFPHSIAIDARNRLYVADGNRAKRRIVVLDTLLNVIDEAVIDVPVPSGAYTIASHSPSSGEPDTETAWSLCIPPGSRSTLFVSDAHPGRIYKLSLSDLTVSGVLGESGKAEAQFGWIHAIACPTEHLLYVAELLNWRVQRLSLLAGTGAADGR